MEIKRNSDVFFRTTFKDQNGLTMQPASVTLRVSFKKFKKPGMATMAMQAQGDGSWLGIWTAANVDEGDCNWAVLGTGLTNVSDQGCFTIIANPANP